MKKNSIKIHAVLGKFDHFFERPFHQTCTFSRTISQTFTRWNVAEKSHLGIIYETRVITTCELKVYTRRLLQICLGSFRNFWDQMVLHIGLKILIEAFFYIVCIGRSVM